MKEQKAKKRTVQEWWSWPLCPVIFGRGYHGAAFCSTCRNCFHYLARATTVLFCPIFLALLSTVQYGLGASTALSLTRIVFDQGHHITFAQSGTGTNVNCLARAIKIITFAHLSGTVFHWLAKATIKPLLILRGHPLLALFSNVWQGPLYSLCSPFEATLGYF